MAGPYSGPYHSSDPNKDLDTVEDEALRAWSLLKRGWSYDEIAADLGVSRRTVANRLSKLTNALGDLGGPLRRMAELDRLELYTRKIHEALENGEMSYADLAKLIGAGARVSDARLKLLAPPEAPETESDPEMEQWVEAARAESEAELEKVRNGHGRPAAS